MRLPSLLVLMLLGLVGCGSSNADVGRPSAGDGGGSGTDAGAGSGLSGDGGTKLEADAPPCGKRGVDSAFGKNGIVTLPNMQANSLLGTAVPSAFGGGYLLIGGSVARVRSDGSLDTAFAAAASRVLSSIPDATAISDVWVSDRTGRAYLFSPTHIASLLLDGERDASFGGGKGYVAFPEGGGGRTAAIDGLDGSLMLYRDRTVFALSREGALLRTCDTSFGLGGDGFYRTGLIYTVGGDNYVLDWRTRSHSLAPDQPVALGYKLSKDTCTRDASADIISFRLSTATDSYSEEVFAGVAKGGEVVLGQQKLDLYQPNGVRVGGVDVSGPVAAMVVRNGEPALLHARYKAYPYDVTVTRIDAHPGGGASVDVDLSAMGMAPQDSQKPVFRFAIQHDSHRFASIRESIVEGSQSDFSLVQYCVD